jgi:PAS domain S-box-containing protein
LAGEQFLRGETAEDGTAYAAVSRSQLTGWFFALTVPSAELDALLYQSVALVGGGGVLLLMSGLGVGLIFARRASDSIIKLSAAAHDLGSGGSVSFPRSSPIAELDALATEMARAGRLLREREEERDRVELELRQQEENLQRQADLLNLANEAIFATRLDSRILYWNRGAEQLYGYTHEEALGASSHELLASEFPGGFSRLEAELVRAGEWTGELRQKTKQGRRIDVESRFKLIQDRAGSHLVLECSRDITQRKKAARRLALEHQVTMALAESESHEAAWERLLAALGKELEWEAAAFWLVDSERRMIDCVRSWRAGAGANDCGGRAPLARGMGLPGRVWQGETPLWISDLMTEAHTLQTAYPEIGQVRAAFGFPIKMRGAVLGVVELLSPTVREADAEMMRTVDAMGGEIGQFIERMRAEAALRASEEHLRSQAQQLEQQLLASGRLVAVGELTASMAHEFNNPLGIILGFAQGLLESMDPGDPDYAQVRIIADEAKRCERLVQELLEFGRPKNADFIQIRVEEIIQRTMNLVQPHAAKNRVETAVEIEGTLPSLCADPQQLQQVLLNLSLNAVDAMPKGGRLTVKAARHDDDEMLISVEDSGIGIDADLLPRIFQPFITSKKRRGLGLGLPICDRIVKAHGGKIRVRSRPGEGTAFSVYLPLMPPAAQTQQSAAI